MPKTWISEVRMCSSKIIAQEYPQSYGVVHSYLWKNIIALSLAEVLIWRVVRKCLQSDMKSTIALSLDDVLYIMTSVIIENLATFL